MSSDSARGDQVISDCGTPWTRSGRVDRRVEVVDIAPTLSALLGVAVPAASEGKPLPLGAR